mmetsp:Transcript_1089/g.2295  ORF Transcript_1089/g.2295 Transcript_1089/m.2295 type:complete len:207 (-) Transcript_1089:417-1037(-)
MESQEAGGGFGPREIPTGGGEVRSFEGHVVEIGASRRIHRGAGGRCGEVREGSAGVVPGREGGGGAERGAPIRRRASGPAFGAGRRATGRRAEGEDTVQHRGDHRQTGREGRRQGRRQSRRRRRRRPRRRPNRHPPRPQRGRHHRTIHPRIRIGRAKDQQDIQSRRTCARTHRSPRRMSGHQVPQSESQNRAKEAEIEIGRTPERS